MFNTNMSQKDIAQVITDEVICIWNWFMYQLPKIAGTTEAAIGILSTNEGNSWELDPWSSTPYLWVQEELQPWSALGA